MALGHLEQFAEICLQLQVAERDALILVLDRIEVYNKLYVAAGQKFRAFNFVSNGIGEPHSYTNRRRAASLMIATQLLQTEGYASTAKQMKRLGWQAVYDRFVMFSCADPVFKNSQRFVFQHSVRSYLEFVSQLGFHDCQKGLTARESFMAIRSLLAKAVGESVYQFPLTFRNIIERLKVIVSLSDIYSFDMYCLGRIIRSLCSVISMAQGDVKATIIHLIQRLTDHVASTHDPPKCLIFSVVLHVIDAVNIEPQLLPSIDASFFSVPGIRHNQNVDMAILLTCRGSDAPVEISQVADLLLLTAELVQIKHEYVISSGTYHLLLRHLSVYLEQRMLTRIEIVGPLRAILNSVQSLDLRQSVAYHKLQAAIDLQSARSLDLVDIWSPSSAVHNKQSKETTVKSGILDLLSKWLFDDDGVLVHTVEDTILKMPATEVYANKILKNLDLYTLFDIGSTLPNIAPVTCSEDLSLDTSFPVYVTVFSRTLLGFLADDDFYHGLSALNFPGGTAMASLLPSLCVAVLTSAESMSKAADLAFLQVACDTVFAATNHASQEHVKLWSQIIQSMRESGRYRGNKTQQSPLVVDYIAAAHLTTKYEMHEETLLYLHLAWTMQGPQCLSQIQAIQTSTYAAIDEVDSYYGVPVSPSIDVALRRAEYEKSNLLKLTLTCATLEEDRLTHSNSVQRRCDEHSSALIATALSDLGMNVLNLGTQAPNFAQQSDGHYRSAINLDQWSLPVPEKPSIQALLYNAYARFAKGKSRQDRSFNMFDDTRARICAISVDRCSRPLLAITFLQLLEFEEVMSTDIQDLQALIEDEWSRRIDNMRTHLL